MTKIEKAVVKKAVVKKAAIKKAPVKKAAIKKDAADFRYVLDDKVRGEWMDKDAALEGAETLYEDEQRQAKVEVVDRRGHAIQTWEPEKAKKAKAKKPAAKQADGDTMVDKIIELASRKEGVTPSELNELTQWKGAPWKWLFSNPKGTGYCDRRGLKFKVEKKQQDKGRPLVTYKVA